MKKILYVFLIMVLAVGCNNLSNTPINKTEQMLKKYQMLDNDVMEDLNKTVDSETTFSEAQKTEYKNIMKKHYQNLVYEIKDDTIDGDEAKVNVLITVTDFKKVLDESEAYLNEHLDEFKDEYGNYIASKYVDYRLEKMSEAKEKVKYTIEIKLTKVNKEWRVDTLSEETLDKINGVYKY